MSKFEGVADTLYIPLTARIYVSEHFPEYFRDDKAVSLKSEMPYEEIASKSSEYFQMAGACRFYNTDRMIKHLLISIRNAISSMSAAAWKPHTSGSNRPPRRQSSMKWICRK